MVPGYRHLLGICGVLAPCLESTALAQSAAPVTLIMGVEARHDDNVARASAERAAVRGVVRSDEVVSPTASVDVLKRFGSHQLVVSGTAAYDFYRRNPFLNRERLAVSASGLIQASSCLIILSPGFARRQSDLSDIAVPLTGTRRSITNVETVQTYKGSVQCGDEIGLKPYGAIEHTNSTNSTDFRQFSNNLRTVYTGGIGYAQPAFGKIQILLAKEHVTYPNRPRIGPDEDGYTARQAGVRFERGIGANLQLTAQGNYIMLQPRRTSAPDFTGLTYEVTMTATFADRLQLEAALSKQAEPSLQSDATYRVARQWTFTGTYAATSLLSLRGNATFGKRRFAGELPTFGPLLGSDRRHTYLAGADYALTSRLNIGLEIRQQSRKADDPFYDYRSLSELLSVKFVY